ncbi:alpha/beta fold hydrolase [Leptolyngbya sp. NIES-2104]|uniref:alpha/beta fold hydrolase n=1 Tax=Leptolyngbya sp. NIES-2104 TaxID=1552121 RepID=UPI0006EC7071|nr:alpha/beta hydrolase [Leptolyngbya sp. NIES-2104]GAP95615.1 probable hydrolase [Leptolyngbya sp. NIES-2104]
MNRFSLKVWIDGSGYPIVCLHGHPGSGRSMGVFTQHLSKRFQTVAPDLRGYGQSKTRENFVMLDHLDDLQGVLDSYGIDRALILGWSLGGIVALELAARFPEKVSGLILIGTSARPWGDHPKISVQDNLYTGIAALLNIIKPGWKWNIETFGKRSLFRHLIQQHTPETYRYIASDAVYAFLNTSPAANRALTAALRQGAYRVQDLEKITCPVLMLAGEHDRHINASSSVHTAEQLTNCECKVYPKTAHLLPWEIPNQMLADVDEWLDRHPEAWH